MNYPDILKKSVYIICILGFLAGIAAFAYMGVNMRLIGDDYCEAAMVTKHGFINGQIRAYFDPVPFHGNRYTKTFIATFISLFPPKAYGFVPLSALIVFGLGLYVFQSAIFKLLHQEKSKLFKVFVSVVIVFFTFLYAPTVNQSLYWTSAMLPSTAPIFGTLYLMALLLTQSKLKWYMSIIVFIFALINGGLSENGSMLQLALISITLIVSRSFFKKSDIYRSIFNKSVSALIGALSAIIIMWVSPSISQKQSEMTLSILQTIRMSLNHSMNFYLEFIKSFILSIGFLIVIGIFAYLLETWTIKSKQEQKPVITKKILLSLFLTHLVVFLLILSNMIPSALTRNTYPDPRHLIIATFASTLGFFSTGYIVGVLFDKILRHFEIKEKFMSILIIGIGLITLTGLYPVRYIPHIINDQMIFKYWSYQWDRRHNEINEKIISGERVIHVMQLHTVIEYVSELSPDLGNWYNLCAADYYGISKIYADQPGWDEEWNEFKSLYSYGQ